MSEKEDVQKLDLLLGLSELEKGEISERTLERIKKVLPHVKAAHKEMNDISYKLGWAIAGLENHNKKGEGKEAAGRIFHIFELLASRPIEKQKALTKLFRKVLHNEDKDALVEMVLSNILRELHVGGIIFEKGSRLRATPFRTQRKLLNERRCDTISLGDVENFLREKVFGVEKGKMHDYIEGTMNISGKEIGVTLMSHEPGESIKITFDRKIT